MNRLWSDRISWGYKKAKEDDKNLRYRILELCDVQMFFNTRMRMYAIVIPLPFLEKPLNWELLIQGSWQSLKSGCLKNIAEIMQYSSHTRFPPDHIFPLNCKILGYSDILQYFPIISHCKDLSFPFYHISLGIITTFWAQTAKKVVAYHYNPWTIRNNVQFHNLGNWLL